jgi:hypothetical protein
MLVFDLVDIFMSVSDRKEGHLDGLEDTVTDELTKVRKEKTIYQG